MLAKVRSLCHEAAWFVSLLLPGSKEGDWMFAAHSTRPRVAASSMIAWTMMSFHEPRLANVRPGTTFIDTSSVTGTESSNRTYATPTYASLSGACCPPGPRNCTMAETTPMLIAFLESGDDQVAAGLDPYLRGRDFRCGRQLQVAAAGDYDDALDEYEEIDVGSLNASKGTKIRSRGALGSGNKLLDQLVRGPCGIVVDDSC